MREDLRIRAEAAVQALGPLVDRHAEGVPWHYEAQISKLRRDVEDAERALYPMRSLVMDEDGTIREKEMDPQTRAEMEWTLADRLFRALRDAVHRLRNGPIVKPDVAAAAEELVPLVRDLEAEVERLLPAWYREERDGPDGSWPAGINPTHDDLDLGRKD